MREPIREAKERLAPVVKHFHLLCELNFDGGGPHLFSQLPVVWQIRVILAPTTADNYVVLTPDYDIYEEQLSMANADLVDFHYGGADWHLDPRISVRSVQAFAPMTPAELARFIQQGLAGSSRTTLSSWCGCRRETCAYELHGKVALNTLFPMPDARWSRVWRWQ